MIGGSGRMKIDDDLVQLQEWDVLRVPPGTWRGYEARPEGLELIVYGPPNLGEVRATTSRASAAGGLTSAGSDLLQLAPRARRRHRQTCTRAPCDRPPLTSSTISVTGVSPSIAQARWVAVRPQSLG
jgi:hypothetical protein